MWRSKNGRTTSKDKIKDSTRPAGSTLKRPSAPESSLSVQSHMSSVPTPYASLSSFSALTTAPLVPSIPTALSPQPPPLRVIVHIPPTLSNIFALQLKMPGFVQRLRLWVGIHQGGEKDTLGFTTTTERRPSDNIVKKSTSCHTLSLCQDRLRLCTSTSHLHVSSGPDPR